jgi:N6-adenosine-specific RNA methylase IME4
MRYQTIVIDPPWPQKGGGPLKGREGFLDATGASQKLPYGTMSISAIYDLYIPAADDCVLYLWTTSGFLHEAFPLLHHWGFAYSTTLVWAKNPIGSGLGGPYGIATEFVLLGRRGRTPVVERVGRNWWNWKRPYDERGKPQHSAKPEEFYAMVEQVTAGPYLDMFARRSRLGWDVWGDEAPGSVDLSA